MHNAIKRFLKLKLKYNISKRGNTVSSFQNKFGIVLIEPGNLPKDIEKKKMNYDINCNIYITVKKTKKQKKKKKDKQKTNTKINDKQSED